MVRLLRALPELMILIKGMLAAARSVFFTLLLLSIIHYIFGIALVQLTTGYRCGGLYFRTVPLAMLTLLTNGTLLDNIGQVITDMADDAWYLQFIWFFFTLLSTYLILNMLVGVLVEVVSVVAATEKEEMMVAFVKQKMLTILEETGIDKNGDGEISRDEFMQILTNHQATRALAEVGVDPIGLVDFAEFIFEDSTSEERGQGRVLSFEEFMEIILQLRGCNLATVKEMMDLRKFVRQVASRTSHRLQRIEVSQSQALKNRKLRREGRLDSSTSACSGRPGDSSCTSKVSGALSTGTMVRENAPTPAGEQSEKHNATVPSDQSPVQPEDPELQAWLEWCEQNLIARQNELQQLLQGVTASGMRPMSLHKMAMSVTVVDCSIQNSSSDPERILQARRDEVAARMARLSQLLGDGLQAVRIQRKSNGAQVEGETQSDLV